MAELLLEVRTGGYPLGPLPNATRELKDQLVRRLRDAGLVARQSAVAWGPRRMTVILRGLPEVSASGTSALAQVASAVEAAAAVEWPEAYRNELGATPWPRPVTGVLALFDGAVVPATVGGIAAGASTVGHPTLSPRRFRALDGDDYGRKLAERGIEVRPAERSRRLTQLFESAAESAGGRVLPDPDLVESLAHGCEIPGVVVGTIEPELDLPRELIQACCRRHLRALVVVQGERVVAFVTAIDRPDDPEGRVRRGTQCWLATQLTALARQYREDQRVPLAERAERVASRVSDPALGSFGARVERSIRLAAGLCADLECERHEAETVARALRLLHADRGCGVVREMPELQGVVGGLLARTEGLPETVWQAIYDAGSGGLTRVLPRGRAAQVVALADRLDALTAIVAGSAESQASPQVVELADRVVGVLVEAGLPIDLDLAGGRAVRLHPELGARAAEALASVRRVLASALVRVLRRQGFAAEEIRAVLAADVGRQLPLIVERLRGLRSLRAEPELRAVAQAARRLVDILHEAPESVLDVALLVEDAEKDLYVLLPKLRRALEGSMLAGRYREWLGMMATLAGAVDRFFREVLVRDEVDSLRLNRLALLQSAQRPFAQHVRLAELVTQPSGSGISAATSP